MTEGGVAVLGLEAACSAGLGSEDEAADMCVRPLGFFPLKLFLRT